MKKINLFCAAGMSTSMLVTKMRQAAKETGYECEINAYPLSEVEKYGPDSDIILLGPQVRFEAKRVQGLLPDKRVEMIDMRAYGMMDGATVMKNVRTILGD